MLYNSEHPDVGKTTLLCDVIHSEHPDVGKTALLCDVIH